MLEKPRKHCYISKTEKDFSEIALGIIVRSFNVHNIAYLNFSNNYLKLQNFFERLSIEFNFQNRLFKRISFYVQKNFIYEKLFIPEIEFQNIQPLMLINDLKKYDLVIIDKINFNNVNRNLIVDFLENINESELLLFFEEEKDVKTLEKHFDLVSRIKYIRNKTIISKNNITSVFGDGKGKTTFILGDIIDKLIKKESVRLITFDKGGNFYSEKRFLDILREYSLKTKKIDFDYVYTGIERFDVKTNKFRYKNNEKDFIEAEDALKLLKTIVKKSNFNVYADELNTCLLTKLLDKKKVIEILKESKAKLTITGRIDLTNNLNEYCSNLIKISNIKHYFNSKNNFVKIGIDY